MENKQFVEFDGKQVLVTGASSGIGRASPLSLIVVGLVSC